MNQQFGIYFSTIVPFLLFDARLNILVMFLLQMRQTTQMMNRVALRAFDPPAAARVAN